MSIRIAPMSPPAALLLLIPALACAGDGSGDAPRVVRDSAGVRIVEDRADTALPRWRVAPDPVASIGAAAGDSTDLLFGVVGAHRLPGDRVVIANRGTYELRFYDADGRLERTAGRRGDGPEEFQFLTWTARCGASIHAYDLATRRVSVWDFGGEFLRVFPVAAPNGTPLDGPASCREDGVFVAKGRAPPAAPPRAGAFREDEPVFVMDSMGQVLAELGTFASTDRWVLADEARVQINRLPFGRTKLVAMGPDLAFVGTGDAPRVLGFDPEGALRLDLRWSAPDRILSSADRTAYEEERLAAVADEDARRTLRRVLDDVPYPARLPSYEQLVVDAEGRLWVAEYLAPRDGARSWDVFYAGGTLLARATTPRALHVYEIADGRVVGSERDALGVEYVRVYELVRP